MTDKQCQQLMDQVRSLLSRVEDLLPEPISRPDFEVRSAFRWRCGIGFGRSYLEAVHFPHQISPENLLGVDSQKAALEQNTLQFVQGYPANNALLWGARGTGKSSLIKAMLHRFQDQGLRLVEVDKHQLVDLPHIVDQLHPHAQRFILFCDDLSFDAHEPGYKSLKAALDGSISGMPDNILIYATSNRRHLVPEFLRDNLDTRHVDGEIHPSEGIEERISLSERFGICLSFYPLDQEQYLSIAYHWLKQLLGYEAPSEAVRNAALKWALSHGSRSGRVAWHFAKHWAGKTLVDKN